jgi:outer membrane lipoprotein-sorting protein
MFATVHAQQDEKAKNILDQVRIKIGSFQSIQADFIFTMKSTELGINEKNEGNIILKGQKYCMDLPDVGMKMFSNGETTWNYMKDGNQVTITNISDASELMDPVGLFNIYEKGFNPKFLQETTVAGKTVYILELFPDNSNNMDVSKISVNIDKSTIMLQSVLLYGTDGNQYGIEIKNMATNKNFPDSEFVFDAGKFPDVEIIDLR